MAPQALASASKHDVEYGRNKMYNDGRIMVSPRIVGERMNAQVALNEALRTAGIHNKTEGSNA